MSSSLSRRKLLTGSVATAAGATGLSLAARFADRNGLIPPDHGGIYGIGETLTYASQRILMSRGSLAREFKRSNISEAFPVNGAPPRIETYQNLLAKEFVDWRLSLDGLVARPALLSLADLKRYPARTQITHMACEEGWSAIAEWTGVPLALALDLAGVQPQARYVVFYSFDEAFGFESLDMADARHPQTLLAYGMNGQALPAAHGAPVRLRVPRQLGYKSIKFLSRVTVTDSLKNLGKGLGSSAPEAGYSWYAGI